MVEIHFDEAFTRDWWRNLQKDDERLRRFIQKLHRTEADGFTDNLEASAKWVPDSHPRAEAYRIVFRNTAEDERRHASLLENLLLIPWGIPMLPPPSPSIYWNRMYAQIDSLESMCAVLYLGEELAARRFEVMLDVGVTHDPVKEFLEEALPDEEYHAKTFKRMAGQEAIEKLTVVHNQLVMELMRR